MRLTAEQQAERAKASLEGRRRGGSGFEQAPGFTAFGAVARRLGMAH